MNEMDGTLTWRPIEQCILVALSGIESENLEGSTVFFIMFLL